MVVGVVFYLLSTVNKSEKKYLMKLRERQRQEAADTPVDCKWRTTATDV